MRIGECIHIEKGVSRKRSNGRVLISRHGSIRLRPRLLVSSGNRPAEPLLDQYFTGRFRNAASDRLMPSCMVVVFHTMFLVSEIRRRRLHVHDGVLFRESCVRQQTPPFLPVDARRCLACASSDGGRSSSHAAFSATCFLPTNIADAALPTYSDA